MRTEPFANFSQLKNDLKDQIENLPDGDVYELIMPITDGELPFLHVPKETLSCDTCKAIYGKCTVGEDGGSMVSCKEKFLVYHGSGQSGAVY